MLKPLFARVLLRRPKMAKIGHILLPEESQKRYAALKCEVVAVGPTADSSIKEGSQVLIGRYAGDWLHPDGTPGNPDDGAELFIVQDEDILAEITDD